MEDLKVQFKMYLSLEHAAALKMREAAGIVVSVPMLYGWQFPDQGAIAQPPKDT